MSINVTNDMPGTVSPGDGPIDTVTHPQYGEGGGFLQEEPASLTEKSITSWVDKAAILSEERPVYAFPTNPDPFPDQGLSAVLSRPYQVGSFSWLSTDAVGAQVAAYNFPDDLLSIPNISDKLENFSFQRSGVRVSIRITATRFHQGALLISFNPVSDVPVSMMAASWLDHYTVSANTQEPVEIILPWQNPKQYYEIHSPTNQRAIGTLTIHVLSKLTTNDPAVVASASVAVFAGLEQPQQAGLIPVEAAVARRYYNGRRRNTVVRKNQYGQIVPSDPLSDLATETVHGKPQSASSKDTEAEEKTLEGIVSGPLESLRDLSAGIERWPLVGDYAEVATPILSWIAEAARTIGLQKPQELSLETRFTPSLGSQGITNSRGAFSGISFNLDPKTHPNNNPCIFNSSVKDEMSIPTLCRIPSLLAYGDTITTTMTTGDVIGRWSMCPGAMHNDGTNFHPSILSWLSLMARYYRGSIKVLIKFWANMATSCRVRWSYIPAGVSTGASYSEAALGDIFSGVIQIEGDTTVELNIPYLAPDFYMSTLGYDGNGMAQMTGYSTASDVESNPSLMLTLSAPLTNMTSTAAGEMGYSVWWAGGEDFRLYVPVGLDNASLTEWQVQNTFEGQLPTETVPKRQPSLGKMEIYLGAVYPQSSIRAAFNKPFLSFVSGVDYSHFGDNNFGETWMTIQDLVLRGRTTTALVSTQLHTAGESVTTVGPGAFSTATTDCLYIFRDIIRMFRFMRTGIRVTQVKGANDNTQEYSMTPTTASTIGEPYAPYKPGAGTTPFVVPVECPYRSNDLFYVIDNYNYLSRLYNQVPWRLQGFTAGVGLTYIQMTDDVMFGQLRYPGYFIKI